MEHNYLSLNCGLKVSPICLGTMTFKRDLEQHVSHQKFLQSCCKCDVSTR